MQSAIVKGKPFGFEDSLSTHHYIEKIAQGFSNQPALTDGNHTINYRELNERANQIAHFLISEMGIQLGDVVGLSFKPSNNFIQCLLAIMKIGAVYLPLDVNYAEEYFNLIVNNAQPKIILTNVAFSFKNKAFFDVTTMDVEKYPKNNLAVQFTLESPAYILYTSGSTGQPKGVVIPHRALINHMLWMQDEFQFQENDKILLKTPITFDPSIWEIFIPFFSGAELIIAPPGSHIDVDLLFKLVKKYQITTIQFVPFILHNFLNHPRVRECQSLKKVFVGGESLSLETKKIFFSTLACELINLYGPTETTIDITYFKVRNVAVELNKNYIGMPIYNTELYVLNENLEICNTKEIGELYVAGKSVGLGYLNNLLLTKKCFIDNPFSSEKIIYKTGDMVRYTKNGLIEYIGRKDKQIKINGVRVELDAITSKIMEQENIVYCYITKNQEEIYSYLICYIVPEKGKKVDVASIKKRLMNIFPPSIVPRQFYVIEKVPLLSSGKIDIHALKKNIKLLESQPDKLLYIENKIQKNLLHLCRKLLNNDAIKVNDELYNSGIDSLSSLLLIENIKKHYHVNLMIHELLSSKTVNNLSKLIRKKIKLLDANTSDIVIPLRKTGHKTPVFLIHPIGGTIFWYTHLAKYFDLNRPLYAIQDPGIESEGYFFERLEEMAHFYFNEIKRIQPIGPYIIGGASFGATVAIEICRHLNKNEVIAIPVLDGWGIYPDDLKDENYFRKSMCKQQNDWKSKFGKYGYTSEFERLFSMQKHRLELLYQYKMKKIKHNILLFKAKEIMEVFLPINCHDNNWRKYTRGQLEIINVDGNHETMFYDPYVKNLSLMLSSLIEQQEMVCG